MLKQRLLTAIVLIPLVIWGVLALPTAALAIILGAIVLLGSWEWTRMIGLNHLPARITYQVLTGVVLASVFWLLNVSTHAALWIFILALAAWLLHLYLVSVYPRQQDLWRNISTRTLAGLLILVPAWTAVVYLQGLSDQGPAYVLFLLLLIWCADTAAYFGGRAWGKRKLLVNVSPGKTWEGAGSALVAVGVLSWVGAHILGVAAEQLSVFIGLSLVTVLFSILGDLIESMYKRQAGLKDSGTLLPGHGGVLDRIDSLTAAAPIFVLGLLSSGILPQWQTL